MTWIWILFFLHTIFSTTYSKVADGNSFPISKKLGEEKRERFFGFGDGSFGIGGFAKFHGHGGGFGGYHYGNGGGYLGGSGLGYGGWRPLGGYGYPPYGIDPYFYRPPIGGGFFGGGGYGFNKHHHHHHPGFGFGGGVGGFFPGRGISFH